MGLDVELVGNVDYRFPFPTIIHTVEKIPQRNGVGTGRNPLGEERASMRGVFLVNISFEF